MNDKNQKEPEQKLYQLPYFTQSTYR